MHMPHLSTVKLCMCYARMGQYERQHWDEFRVAQSTQMLVPVVAALPQLRGLQHLTISCVDSTSQDVEGPMLVNTIMGPDVWGALGQVHGLRSLRIRAPAASRWRPLALQGKLPVLALPNLQRLNISTAAISSISFSGSTLTDLRFTLQRDEGPSPGELSSIAGG